MSPAPRRVVTANDAAGKSHFLHDGETPGRLEIGIGFFDQIWVDDPGDPEAGGTRDPVSAKKVHLEPPVDGSRMVVVTFEPESRVTEEGRDDARFDDDGAMEPDEPGMHTTRTIDYGAVLSGEIVLELDASEVTLRAGDTIVQRGTRHRWYNRGSEPCTMAFVMVASPNFRTAR